MTDAIASPIYAAELYVGIMMVTSPSVNVVSKFTFACCIYFRRSVLAEILWLVRILCYYSVCSLFYGPIQETSFRYLYCEWQRISFIANGNVWLLGVSSST